MILLLAIVVLSPIFMIFSGDIPEEKRRIAIFLDDEFAGGIPAVERCLAPIAQLYSLSAERIQKEGLIGYDMIVFPGGSGKRQGDALGATGRTLVREFVQKGGGFLGICAGAFLAGILHPQYLHLINMTVANPTRTALGKGRVKICLQRAAESVLGIQQIEGELYYANGPLMIQGAQADLPPYTDIAQFDTELPDTVMRGYTAIAAAEVGNGRVFLSSAHTEHDQEYDFMLRRAALWVARKK